MPYCHYWMRSPILPQSSFIQCSKDIQLLIREFLKHDVLVCGLSGAGSPLITSRVIAFNGQRACQHPKRDLGVPFPANNAFGISLMSGILDGGIIGTQFSDVEGDYFAGKLLKTRTCDGKCSDDDFYFPLKRNLLHEKEPAQNGMVFDFCRTSYKPYDLLVQCSLIVASRYFKDELIIQSDGSSDDWQEARELTKKLLGYGLTFRLSEDSLLEIGTW
jgi:hypothetical protein